MNIGSSVNWDAHTYSALVISNCWTCKKSAAEIGWNHKDSRCVNDTPFCHAIKEGAILPDDRELWQECSRKHSGLYMTPECPPPPPYHHKPIAVKFAEYYLTLARREWLNGNKVEAAKHFGIALHYVADSIIEPYVLQRGLQAVWEYEEVVAPVNEGVLKTRPDEVFAVRTSIFAHPSVYDFLRYYALKARSHVARGEYEKAVSLYWKLGKTLFVAMVKGYYGVVVDKDEAYASGAMMLGSVALISLGILKNKELSTLGVSILGLGIPFLMYQKEKMWESDREGVISSLMKLLRV